MYDHYKLRSRTQSIADTALCELIWVQRFGSQEKSEGAGSMTPGTSRDLFTLWRSLAFTLWRSPSGKRSCHRGGVPCDVAALLQLQLSLHCALGVDSVCMCGLSGMIQAKRVLAPVLQLHRSATLWATWRPAPSLCGGLLGVRHWYSLPLTCHSPHVHMVGAVPGRSGKLGHMYLKQSLTWLCSQRANIVLPVNMHGTPCCRAASAT